MTWLIPQIPRKTESDRPPGAGIESCQIEYDSDSLADASIHREDALEQGRIDLLIERGDGFILGIENKIYSPEGTARRPIIPGHG